MVFVYSVIAISALVAGFIQGISGFGAGMVSMCAVPYFLGVTSAAAVSSCMSLSLNALMTYRYRHSIRTKPIWLPALFFILGSTVSIYFSTGVDRKLLKLILGVFLIALAVYFIYFSRKIRINTNMLTMFTCGFLSGVSDGLFGIGGPLMVLFFLAATQSKKEYLGTISLFFLIVGTYNLGMRIYRGIITAELLPYVLVSLAAVIAGLKIGNRVVDSIDETRLRKMVYALIGVSGLLTFATSLAEVIG